MTDRSEIFAIESQAIAGLIARQRQEQEALLRTFTSGPYLDFPWAQMARILILLLEISGEIKGERLRFVEAMKEATAINVQREVFLASNNEYAN